MLFTSYEPLISYLQMKAGSFFNRHDPNSMEVLAANPWAIRNKFPLSITFQSSTWG